MLTSAELYRSQLTRDLVMAMLWVHMRVRVRVIAYDA